MKRATENVISGDLEEHVLEDVSDEEQRASFSICNDLGKIGPVSKDELELVYETSNKTGKHGREKFNRGDRDVYKRTEVSEKSGLGPPHATIGMRTHDLQRFANGPDKFVLAVKTHGTKVAKLYSKSA
ncbi:unnamed protein product [Bemisia tabaci]|uniref:Uncharacterized protein n=1 Tax=Bemisia tabaci TaxID=7038 RepID=A0A9P0A941_BEMTA|nr:unnamed protein product [Bemisia tabaci]